MPPATKPTTTTTNPDSSSSSFKPHHPFPLSPPYNTRLIGFGCPDVSLPQPGRKLGPKKVVWKESDENEDENGENDSSSSSTAITTLINTKFHSSKPSLPLVEYDLSHHTTTTTPLSSQHILQLCNIMKTPIRRSAMKILKLNHTSLTPSSLQILTKFFLTSPSTLAPINLDLFDVQGNNIWGKEFSSLVKGMIQNGYVQVKEMNWNDTHVGRLTSIGNGSESSGASVKGQDEVKSEEHDNSSPSTSPSALLQIASQYYTPLLTLLQQPSILNLHILHLSRCSMTDIMLVYLAEGLRTNSSLKELYLAGNLITDAGAECLAKALGYVEPAPVQQNNEESEEAAAANARIMSAGRGRTGSANSGGMKLALKNVGAAAGGGVKPGSKRLTNANQVQDDESAASSDTSSNPHLPSFPPTTSVNTTLHILDLSSNTLSIRGIRLLAGMTQVHPALRDVLTQGNTKVHATADTSEYNTLQDEIRTACMTNRKKSLVTIKKTCLLGLHQRVGRNSSMRTLMLGAREQLSVTYGESVHESAVAELLTQALSEVWLFVGHE